MSSVGPWSVKGIDSRAREIAKDQARRSGQTLGEWLNTRIIDPDAEPPPPATARWEESNPAPSSPIYRAEPRTPPPREPARSWSERRAPDDAKADDMRRVADALGEISARLDEAERRSTLAISGVDQQVTGVLGRLDALDHAHADAVSRVEAQVVELRDAQFELHERLRTTQDENGPRIEAMKALEGALGKLAAQMLDADARHRKARDEAAAAAAEIDHRVEALAQRSENAADAELVESRLAELATRLDQAEARTRLAVRALETSFGGLDRRMSDVRAGPEAAQAAFEARFTAFGEDLTRKLEASQTRFSTEIQQQTAGRLEALDGRMREAAAAAGAAEKRATTAIDSVGREVVRIAEGLGARIAASEARQSQSEARIGGELGRIGAAVEARLQHNDSAQADALERLGQEITRIAEKLADRIAASEQRAAQDSAELGDQIGRVSATLAAQHEPAASVPPRSAPQEATAEASLARKDSAGDPAPSIINAPEDAQASSSLWRSVVFDPRASAVQNSSGVADDPGAALAPAATSADADRLEPPPSPYAAPADFDSDDFAAELFKSGPFDPPPPAAPLRIEPDLGAQRAPLPAPLEPPLELGSTQAPRAPAPEGKAVSTRELIEAARAAARAAADARARRAPIEPASAAPLPPLSPLSPLPAAFEPAPDTRSEAPFAAPTWRRKRPSGTFRTLAISSIVAGSIAATGSGLWLLASADEHHAAGAAEPREARPAGDTLALALSPPVAAVAPPLVVIARRAPPVAARPAPMDQTEAEAAGSAQALFATASASLAHDNPEGLAGLRRAANLGYAPAQFYLGRLYEEGRAGVRKDLAEARHWTERAALQGDIHAMFNLGLFFATGDGGARSAEAAVVWFQRAAAAGVRDAQYNLAVMYQNGDGVARSPEQALKWYLVAAASGDEGAKAAAGQIRPLLTPERRAAAERDAATLDSRLAGAPTPSVAD